MNILLWVLQFLLALHTAMGALWKFSNPEVPVPSLKAIPRGAWLSMGVVELIAAVALVLPLIGSLGVLVPIAAAFIVIEMLVFCAVHLRSGASEHGTLMYWLGVAVVSGFVIFGRLVLQPL